MVNRSSRIYTRTGDEGQTGLGDGSRVSKASTRVEVMGEVDELNSMVGFLLAQEQLTDFRERLKSLQHLLFDLGGELSRPGKTVLDETAVAWLEDLINDFDGQLPPLREFILPGGNTVASICHLARAICRRCERHMVLLSETEFVNPLSRIFLNRLSDLLFVLARTLATRGGGREIVWKKDVLK